MPDDNDNYALLLEKLDQQQKKIEQLEQRVAQVTEFNRQLLNRAKPENISDETDNKVAKEKLEKFLGEV